MLQQCDGPDCSRCGCRDVQVLSELQSFATANGEPWIVPGRARCRHCDLMFSWKEGDKPQENHRENNGFAVQRCPECGSRNTLVVSSPAVNPGAAKKRYHRCEDCRGTFKTTDRE